MTLTPSLGHQIKTLKVFPGEHRNFWYFCLTDGYLWNIRPHYWPKGQLWPCLLLIHPILTSPHRMILYLETEFNITVHGYIINIKRVNSKMTFPWPWPSLPILMYIWAKIKIQLKIESNTIVHECIIIMKRAISRMIFP